MKYAVVIIDGASGWPLPQHENKTCLELADTKNLDDMAGLGMLGLARTVPSGMEPSSACACMSVLGFDPRIYYRGRSAIEAISMGVPTSENDVVFRCNLVTIQDGRMRSYSSGYISTWEAREIIQTLDAELGSEDIRFFPGTSYRHICRLTGHVDTLQALCTPPHDISEKPIGEYLPKGLGSELLKDLMNRSKKILINHPVNKKRESCGDIPASMIWLFWGSGKIPIMPSFQNVYGLRAAMTSGVDLLRGLATMMGMEVLHISGVTDGQDNDYVAQVTGAINALDNHDLVVIHIESPDEAGHDGSIDKKVEAIEHIDREVIGRLRNSTIGSLRILAMPDHPTPIEIRTHCDEPVPFLLWGDGIPASNSPAFTEIAARESGICFDDGYTVMEKLVKGV